MFSADFVDFNCIQPFRVPAKGAPDFVFVHRRHVQAAFGQGRRNSRARQIFGVWHWVTLDKAAWQVAAQLIKQLPGDIFQHNKLPPRRSGERSFAGRHG
jgi:hypothetical protein